MSPIVGSSFTEKDLVSEFKSQRSGMILENMYITRIQAIKNNNINECIHFFLLLRSSSHVKILKTGSS